MYQSSSSSFSEVATPRGRKSLRAGRSQVNGKGAARVQKEKNGTIVKDELVLFDKEGMHPDVLHFFRDELEKQAISPGFAVKHWNSPGIRGSTARGYGKLFGPGGALNPERVNRLNTAAHNAARPEVLAMGPEFAMATAKGLGKAEAAKSLIPAIKKNPRVADMATYWEQNVPSHLFGEWYGKVKDTAGPAATHILGL